MRQQRRSPPHLRTGDGRLITVVEVLAGLSRPPTVAQLGQHLGVSRPQAYRIAAALEREGVIARHPVSGRLMFGLRLARAAVRAASLSPLAPLWRPILHSVVDEIGETCNLLTFPAATPTYLDRVEARWPLAIHMHVGSRVPLHCTAGGKLFLANLPGPARDALLAHLPLPQLTPRTATTEAVLKERLAAVAMDGFAVDDEEFMEGMVAIAVPVRDGSQRFLAGLAIHAPTARQSVASLRNLLPRLHAAAAAIAAIMVEDVKSRGTDLKASDSENQG